jgi:N6-adenosine-specific RNA methylase IME4
MIDDAKGIPLSLRRVRSDAEATPMNSTGVPVLYDTACRALAEARQIDEVKDWADKAAAIRVYARQAKNRELEINAIEIRARAERRLGELIQTQEKTVGLNKGARGIGTSAVPRGNDTPPTLESLGISKKLSSHVQKLARIPQAAFEKKLAEWRDHALHKHGTLTMSLLKEETTAFSSDEERQAQDYKVPGIEKVVASGRCFTVIYADPQGLCDKDSGQSSALTNAQLTRLPVKRLASQDCTLILRTRPSMLSAALALIQKWHFNYQSIGFILFTPDDETKFSAPGTPTRAELELFLLAVRGSPKLIADLPEVVILTAVKHEECSRIVRAQIAELLPGPYLDLFGVAPVDGWTVAGEERDSRCGGLVQVAPGYDRSRQSPS